ncbi:hypothetical protein C8R47DRAFT_1193172 [Mycena vitilis]|nr:hypothetical protein C8R47DRAFT_1193172 [Mycena vitilis]
MFPSPPSDSSLKAFTQRKRIYVACVHCRKRKIRCIKDGFEGAQCERCKKKGLDCEYVPVCEEREKALFTTPEGSENGSPAPSFHIPPYPPAGAQAYPHHYGTSSPSTQGPSTRAQPMPPHFYPTRGFPGSNHSVLPVDHSNWWAPHPTALANPTYPYATNPSTPPAQFHAAESQPSEYVSVVRVFATAVDEDPVTEKRAVSVFPLLATARTL